MCQCCVGPILSGPVQPVVCHGDTEKVVTRTDARGRQPHSAVALLVFVIVDSCKVNSEQIKRKPKQYKTQGGKLSSAIVGREYVITELVGSQIHEKVSFHWRQKIETNLLTALLCCKHSNSAQT